MPEYGEKPVSIMLYIADLCNLKCSYCYNIFPRTSKILSVDSIINFLELHHQTLKRPINLLLIGGEPTLHPKFIDLLKHLRAECQFVEDIDVFTNLTASLETYIQALALDAGLSISYHSCCGFDFSQKMLALHSKIAAQLPSKVDNIIEVSLMFEPGQSSEFSKVFTKVARPFRKVVKIWPLYTKLGHFEYSDEERAVCNNLLKALCPAQHLTFEDVQRDYSMSYLRHRCTAGLDSLYIHSDGRAWPCQNDFFYSKPPLFNIHTATSKVLASACQPVLCRCQICRHGDLGVEIT